MNAFQSSYDRPGSAKPYEPESIELVTATDGRSHLELQVKIEDRLRSVKLTLDALQDHGLSGPAAAEELRKIRKAAERIAAALERSPETE